MPPYSRLRDRQSPKVSSPKHRSPLSNAMPSTHEAQQDPGPASTQILLVLLAEELLVHCALRNKRAVLHGHLGTTLLPLFDKGPSTPDRSPQCQTAPAEMSSVSDEQNRYYPVLRRDDEFVRAKLRRLPATIWPRYYPATSHRRTN